MPTSNKSKIAPVPGSTVADAGEFSRMSNTTHDMKVFKNCGKIVIPDQLASFPGARFILIDKIKGDGKKPKERKWTTEANYAFNEPKLMGHIRGGGNYGIATGISWLHCIDIDEVEQVRELGILEKLPRTLTVKTGGDGLHYWYEIEGLQKRITFFHPTLKEDGKETEFLHLGEVQSRGNYAIGPNSIHRTGKPYTIIDDSEIAKLSYETLMEILSPLRLKKKETKISTYNPETCKHHDEDVDLSKITWPTGNVEEINGSNGTEYRGTSPFHGSKHGRNFSINPRKGVWCCYKHDSGGGWKELLAVKEGIISCEQAGKNCLSKEQFINVMRRAEELGLIKGQETIEAPIIEIDTTNRTYVEELSPILPNGNLELWIASPRTGKSYTAMKLLINTGEGNYYAPNHEIVRHVLEDAIKMGIRNCVHVEGKQQPGMCRRGENEKFECKMCIMHPDQREEGEIGETWSSITKKSSALLKQKSILTKEKVPIDMCPYYTLIFAEKHADYCFTVINNINRKVGEDGRNRKLTIIDEDTCMNHFYPQSVEIAKITRAHGKIHITTPLDNADISSRIEEIGKKSKRRMTKYAKKINEIKKVLGEMDGGTAEPSIVCDSIQALVKDWNPANVNLDNEEYGNDEDVKFGDIVKCMMYPYTKKRVMMKTRGIVSKIYLLADELHAAINMDWIEKTEKVVIIGAARAEMFVNERGGTIKEISKFRFEDNFVVLVVDDEEVDARGKKGRIKKKMIEIIKTLSGSAEAETMRSMMVLTGSKDEQEAVERMIGNGTFKCTSEGEKALNRVNISGMIADFYANSKISRGLDVDPFNVMFAVGTDFSQPFFSEIDKNTANRITIDEITNSVLRISPTRKRGDEMAKLIVISAGDEWKIKYLSGRVINTKESASGIARVIAGMKIASESTMKEGELKTSHRGTSKVEIYEKMFTKMIDADNYVDEDQVKTIMAQILNLIRSETNKWWTKRDIAHKIISGGKIFDSAIELIAFSRDTQLRKSSSGDIRMKYKKPQACASDEAL
jgi:hypothetical protein